MRGPQRWEGGPPTPPSRTRRPGLGEETGGCNLQGLWGGREQVGEICSMLHCCPSPLSGDSLCLVGPQGRAGGAELSCPPGTHLSSSAANPRPGAPPPVPLSKGEANRHPAPSLPSSPTLDPQLTHTANQRSWCQTPAGTERTGAREMPSTWAAQSRRQRAETSMIQIQIFEEVRKATSKMKQEQKNGTNKSTGNTR